MAFGLYKSAKYYYYPGWHEPATVLDNFINLDAWNALPDDLKAIVAQANTAVNQMVLSEFTARNNQALETLRDKHNVDVRPFSDDILTGLGKLSGEVLRDLVSSNPLSQEVFESLIKFRTQSIAWSKFSESSFAQARILPFKY